MHVELDHFFVMVSRGGPEAQQLIDFGLTEGAANRHPGQGTANRRFFFHNAFLELVWVDDPSEAQSDAVARTALYERWDQRQRGASPFGIAFRPSHDHLAVAPFAVWQYRPPYLPESMTIEMSTSSERASEPLLFYVTFGRRPDCDEPPRRAPIDHRAGLRTITRLRLTGPPHSAASHELRATELACPWLSIAPGGDLVAEIGFDGETAGKSHDFRPGLPLVFRW